MSGRSLCILIAICFVLYLAIRLEQAPQYEFNTENMNSREQVPETLLAPLMHSEPTQALEVASERLSELVGREPEAFISQTSEGIKEVKGYSVRVAQTQANEVLERMRLQLGEGLMVFLGPQLSTSSEIHPGLLL